MSKRKVQRLERSDRVEKFLDDARTLLGFADSETAAGKRDLRDAEIKAKKGLLLDPENYELLVLLAHIHLDRDEFTEGLRYLDQAIALAPDQARAYDSKAQVLIDYLDKPVEAESCARKALSLSKKTGEEPEFLEFRYSTLIDILVARKKYAEARWIVKRALRDCPSDFMKIAVKGAMEVGSDRGRE
jgi:tetratricopeptide (TPR) repeat protein